MLHTTGRTRPARPSRAVPVGAGVLAVVLALVLAGGLLLAPGTAAAPSPVSAADGAASARDRPNVVVVMADDMRVDDLLFAPQVRRLVGAHGLTFDNSFSPYPLCCPARASFLTGTYAHNHQVYWHERPYGYASFDDSRTIATAFRSAGYRTGFIGKYLNGYGKQPSRVSGGPSLTYVPRGWDDWRAAVENPGGGRVHGDAYHYLDTPFNVNGRIDNRYRGRYQTGVIGDFSVDMARKFARGTKPFLMYVSYVAPHFGGPREADDPRPVRDRSGALQEFRTPARPGWVRGRFDRLVDRAAGLPRGGGPSEARIGDKPRAFSSLPEPNAAERRAMRELTRQRAESVFVLDQQVARLVRELQRSGEWGNTVFLFTSDNGYFLGEHRVRTGKVRAHEPSLRVPFLVTGPGMRSGERRHDPITTIDVTATILDLAGARPPRPADGTSRLRTMRGGDRGWDVPVLDEAINTGGGHRTMRGFSGARTSIGVRTGRYSYIRNRTGEHELYDLWRDPLQLTNVFRSADYRRDRARLDRVWWRLRSCRQDQCRRTLPEPLRVDADRLAARTRAYWRAVERTYGFR